MEASNHTGKSGEPSLTAGDSKASNAARLGFAQSCLAKGLKLWDVAQQTCGRPRRKIVLLLQREWLPRLLVQDKLQQAGFKVETVVDLGELSAKVHRRTPDAVVAEVIPGVREMLARCLQEATLTTQPILLLSSEPEPSTGDVPPVSGPIRTCNLMSTSIHNVIDELRNRLPNDPSSQLPPKPLPLGDAERAALENFPGMLRVNIAELCRIWQGLEAAHENEPRANLWQFFRHRARSVLTCAANAGFASLARRAADLCSCIKAAGDPASALKEPSRTDINHAMSRLHRAGQLMEEGAVSEPAADEDVQEQPLPAAIPPTEQSDKTAPPSLLDVAHNLPPVVEPEPAGRTSTPTSNIPTEEATMSDQPTSQNSETAQLVPEPSGAPGPQDSSPAEPALTAPAETAPQVPFPTSSGTVPASVACATDPGSPPPDTQLESDLRDQIASLARATASLERERADRRRSDARVNTLSAQLQALHQQLGQDLETEKALHKQIAALERRVQNTEGNLARAQTDLQRERHERRLAEEGLASVAKLNGRWEENHRLLEDAKASFQRSQKEAEERLKVTSDSLNATEQKLRKEMAERQRLEDSVTALEQKLREQAEDSHRELSRLQSARQFEDFERRRMEEELLQLRCLALDSQRETHAALNELRLRLSTPVQALQQAICCLLQTGLTEAQTQAVQTALENALLLNAELQSAEQTETDLPAAERPTRPGEASVNPEPEPKEMEVLS